MRMFQTIASCSLIAGICLQLYRCAASGVAGGNSSDTGNVVAIAASASTISVTVQRVVKIEVFDQAFAPFEDSGFYIWSSADSGETVTFDIPIDGLYNVLILDTVNTKGLFVSGIHVRSDSTFEKKFDSLFALGGITGIAVDATGDSVLYWTFVYIAGSPFWDYTANTGKFTLENIPPGKYEMRFYGLPPRQIATSVIEYVQPQELTTASDSISVLPGKILTWSR